MQIRPHDSGLNRREFLNVATLAGVATLLAACSGGSEPTTGPVTPGPSTITVKLIDFPALGAIGGIAGVGTVLFAPVAVVRTGQAAYLALSRVCSHAGCVINLATNGFGCPCHGSQFDSQGKVLVGPAPTALTRLTAILSVDGTLLTIS